MLENYFTSKYWNMFEMNEVKKELLAPCGLYCGVCKIYKAHKDNDLEFKKEILSKLHDYGVKSVDDIVCTGCMSNGVVFDFCRTCRIKDCIKNKKIEGCYQCDEFPCKIINDWPDPLDKKVMLRAIPAWRDLGTKKWVKAEEERYQCPKCGNTLFHGAKKCNKCAYIVDLD